MGTVYDSRTFLHDASYPSMTEMDPDHDHDHHNHHDHHDHHDHHGHHDHDRTVDNDGADRFGETDVAELANYHTAAPSSLLPSERTSLDQAAEEARSMLLSDASRLNLSASPPSVNVMPALAPELAKAAEDAVAAAVSLGTDLAAQLDPSLGSTTLPPSAVAMAGMVDLMAAKPILASRGRATPAAARLKLIPKPERKVARGVGGRFYCSVAGCAEATEGFKRRCEWKHEREVHGKHGGPKKTLNCPYQNCKRYNGKGFSRQENLNEHLRRRARGHKRKRSLADVVDRIDVDFDLLEEVKRLRQENLELRELLEQHRETQITMVAQIADLQGALQLNGANLSTAA
ncbi:unnamed protein product [Parascedosporium putredinis]|uniref:C2H2-domain containing protein second zinc finger domain-containing protein n=1 Tax=Parascedosporium putredinis TaxID=1442378 RepID=A0A9P1MC37_9PEZI|nr:unnamed protein product [Parascedosporium putredinis]CAI7995881.1 unnamed protein product [Parascedosporium putredinis]